MYNQIVSDDLINKTVTELSKHNIEGMVVNTKDEALEKIKELIPKGVSVMNGSSTTLQQIGFIDYLKAGNHGWNNLHQAIVEEKDEKKQGLLRKQAVLSDYYLGSVHALSATGEFIVASNTGSQLPHIVSTSANLVFVVGAHKIVNSLNEGLKRLEEYVIPLEDQRMMKEYGVGTHPNKILFFKGEALITNRKIKVIIVKEVLGF
jgi:hypothetical protein